MGDFGAISSDITRAGPRRTMVPKSNGQSWRARYSKKLCFNGHSNFADCRLPLFDQRLLWHAGGP
ncbi:hypothetical protein LNP02_19300 [Klebsiella variicola subsp. variicola]|nr:hypothetical protein [Klebsiella variicola subsp. variicola]